MVTRPTFAAHASASTRNPEYLLCARGAARSPGVTRRGRSCPPAVGTGGLPMSVDRSYVARNNAERARLEALVARLTDADLRRPLAAGWTVAGVLAHLAFWDQRAFILLDRWQREGVTPPPDA